MSNMDSPGLSAPLWAVSSWVWPVSDRALWPVSDRATPPTEGLPPIRRPSVGCFGGVGRPAEPVVVAGL